MARTIMHCEDGKSSIYVKDQDIVEVQKKLLLNGLTLTDVDNGWGSVWIRDPEDFEQGEDNG